MIFQQHNFQAWLPADVSQYSCEIIDFAFRIYRQLIPGRLYEFTISQRYPLLLLLLSFFFSFFFETML